MEALASAALLILGGGSLAVLAAAATLLVYRQIGVKGFGGLSGDLAGWFLQITELTETQQRTIEHSLGSIAVKL